MPHRMVLMQGEKRRSSRLGAHVVMTSTLCLVAARLSLATQVMLYAAATYAQDEVSQIRGTFPRVHSGHRVLGTGRLLSTAADSMASATGGTAGLWIAGTSGRVRPVLRPTGSSDAFGSGAAVARNLTSSSFDVVAAGDPGYGAGRGRVSIYQGPQDLTTDFTSTPSLTIEGEASGDLFGAAVADIGDLNGDGFRDIAIGAPGAGSGTGKVYVYLGGSPPSLAPVATIVGGSPGDLFGSAIAPMGDVDEDGVPDIVVGSTGVQDGQGAVSLFRGGVPLSSAPIQTISYPGSVPGYGIRPRFGSALLASDVDGDGRPELIVGAPGAALERGSAYIFDGVLSGVDPVGREIAGLSSFDQFGAALAAESFIGDGTVNLAVGAPGTMEGRGSVAFFASISGPNPVPTILLQGPATDDAFGFSLGPGRLFTHAPAPQLLIGAPFSDLGAVSGGAVYYYAAPPAVAVEARKLIVEIDGMPALSKSFTSTQPRFRIVLPGAVGLDPTRTRVTVDDQPLESITPLQTAQLGISAGIQVHVQGLAEGAHVLKVYLEDAAQRLGGGAEVQFVSTARLEINEARVVPNPAHSSARLLFTLTRPAAYDLELYDVSGRLVERVRQAVGAAAENELRLGGGARPLAPGMYFYVLSAHFKSERAETRGRLVLLP